MDKQNSGLLEIVMRTNSSDKEMTSILFFILFYGASSLLLFF